MPRRYYSRRTRVVRPKKKWASNIAIKSFTISGASPVPYTDLVGNAAQTALPTPVILKTGNFKINADISVLVETGGPMQFIAVVCFLPQGFSIAGNQEFGTFLNQHPEYIIVWKQFDMITASVGATVNSQQITASSRLKRNLNSGDRIIFGVLDAGAGGATITSVRVLVTAQYWTCAN